MLSDIDAAQARRSPRELGAVWLEPAEALRADVDMLAPCALGGVIDEALPCELRCRVVCGCGQQPARRATSVAEHARDRGILYAPDFIVNAGGLINVALELTGYDAAEARRRARTSRRCWPPFSNTPEHAGVTPLAGGRRARAAEAARGGDCAG